MWLSLKWTVTPVLLTSYATLLCMTAGASSIPSSWRDRSTGPLPRDWVRRWARACATARKANPSPAPYWSVIAQAGPRAPDLDAPSVEDAARTPEERQLIELVVSGTQLGRPMATNAAPADRVTALRAAFSATMRDREFVAEATQLGFEIDPIQGEKMQKIVEKVLATPKGVATRAKGLME